jgi:hypothetical protein
MHEICEFTTYDKRELGPERFAWLVDWAEVRRIPEFIY